jgi:ornithine cyclodeaminase/alanine dehydrogenase-like protein (mu-crystallin family)
MDKAVILGADQVALRLPVKLCIEAVENAFRQLGSGTAATPSTLSIPSVGGGFHIKAGILATERRTYFAAKTNGNFPGNPSRNGLPTIQGVVVLCDALDGRVLALLDSMELTARRTAAATGVAARWLARQDTATVSIIGCGVQAPLQLEAVCSVLPITRAFVTDIDAGRAQSFATRMRDVLRIPVEVAEDPAAAAAGSEMCITCSTSHEYILDDAHVHPGMLIAGVGVDNEHKRELSPALLRAARVVTDLRGQCALIGDLHHAIAAGAMTIDGIHADLGSIVAGGAPGRINDDQLFVFDSTGIALQDVAAAAAVYEAVESEPTASPSAAMAPRT